MHNLLEYFLMSEKLLPRLYYLSDNKPELLPEWAYFFIRLGYRLVNTSSNSHRFVIALAIPTRAFACNLVATGIAFAKADTNNLTNDAHLQYIRSLNPGTPVYVRIANRKHRGVLQGFEEHFGKLYIAILTTESLERKLPLDRYASGITVSDRDIRLPKLQQSGQQMDTPSEFVQICLGNEIANEYIHSSSFEALIIGKKSVIQHETCDIPFICGITSKSSGVKGCLQEILRVRQFSGANRSYRAQCIPASSKTPEKEIGERKPAVVIFDGAVAYIKHGYKWTVSHQIVLLDRTERQFLDAVELLNQNYAYRSTDDFNFPIKIPNGIEMMIYKE